MPYPFGEKSPASPKLNNKKVNKTIRAPELLAIANLTNIKIQIIKKIKPYSPTSSKIANGKFPFSIGAEKGIFMKYFILIFENSEAIPKPIPLKGFSRILTIIGS